jgi:hypothetical protein
MALSQKAVSGGLIAQAGDSVCQMRQQLGIFCLVRRHARKDSRQFGIRIIDVKSRRQDQISNRRFPFW